MAIRRSLLVPLAAMALALGGCSDEDERIDGSGYTYAVPDGWEDASEGAADIELPLEGMLVDSAVAGDRMDDFTTNVNVVREGGIPAGVTARQYAEISLATLRDPAAAGLPREVVEQLEAIDEETLEVTAGAELGGRAAVRWDYERPSGGKETRIRQLSAVRNGAGYTVTLTAVPEAFHGGAEAFDEVVGSWEWE